jgi:membrane associated rhomboid family serine protease
MRTVGIDQSFSSPTRVGDRVAAVTWALLCTAAGLGVLFAVWFHTTKSAVPAAAATAALLGYAAAWSIVTGWERNGTAMTVVVILAVLVTFLVAEYPGVRGWTPR